MVRLTVGLAQAPAVHVRDAFPLSGSRDQVQQISELSASVGELRKTAALARHLHASRTDRRVIRTMSCFKAAPGAVPGVRAVRGGGSWKHNVPSVYLEEFYDRSECLGLLLALAVTVGPVGGKGYAQDCVGCPTNADLDVPVSTGEWLLTKQVNEVNVLFVAAHKGKPIGDLSQNDISVRDDNKPPTAILGFRTEQRLPLRVGVAIDTSSSVTSRFRFEQAAASAFFHQAVNRDGDLGFVMGFENHPTVMQDFVGDPELLSQGVERLKIGGGTALYDAVHAACQKLLHRPEAGHGGAGAGGRISTAKIMPAK